MIQKNSGASLLGLDLGGMWWWRRRRLFRPSTASDHHHHLAVGCKLDASAKAGCCFLQEAASREQRAPGALASKQKTTRLLVGVRSVPARPRWRRERTMVGPKEASPRSFQLYWIVMLLILALPTLAWAGLGGDESSVQADKARMGASVRITRTATHAVHELKAPSGHVIREYVSPSGTVFGIAWQGASKPDLKQLLGDHFEEIQQAMQRRGVRRGPVVINEPGVVFEMGGHMRAFAGRAYLPQLLPAGVPADAIR